MAFLILKNPERNRLHKLQMQSCEILDENNKKEAEEPVVKNEDEDPDEVDDNAG